MLSRPRAARLQVGWSARNDSRLFWARTMGWRTAMHRIDTSTTTSRQQVRRVYGDFFITVMQSN